ncbi:MAG: hypothetical protein IKC06_08035 [Clostridia bacterium]|nr:hypothetical protein [Clostridia bacterium]
MKFWKVFLIITTVTAVSLSFSACGLLAYLGHGTLEESTEINSELSENEIDIGSQPVQDNSAEAPAMDEKELIGDWITVYREGDTIYTHTFTFYEDGTYNEGGCEYLHTSHHPDLFAEYEEGWQPAPMGFPYDRGTYTYADGVVELTCYGSDVDEYQTPVISWVEISEYNGDSAVFVSRSEHHEGQPRMFLKNAEYDFFNVEGLFEAAGVDTAP